MKTVRALKILMASTFLQIANAEDLIVVVDDKQPPSLEFLDYLGSMVETDGELVGPEHFEETVLSDTEPQSGRDTWVSREELYEK
ncbi:MAG: hypothetical protein JJ934_13100 [Pseudomonadales bacterium]|nr:hypothetical protein [Pseudomonadales bacterium]MBO6703010.1 hypothetical protein [Pseudomonadales bacterium]MBO7007504.1 hypothetical protein [Pseudomonadales bacterium]